jgi:hypothetical protein
MLTLTQALLQLLVTGIQVTPQIIALAQSAIAEVELLISGDTPTADQAATIAANLETAHKLLQAS